MTNAPMRPPPSLRTSLIPCAALALTMCHAAFGVDHDEPPPALDVESPSAMPTTSTAEARPWHVDVGAWTGLEYRHDENGSWLDEGFRASDYTLALRFDAEVADGVSLAGEWRNQLVRDELHLVWRPAGLRQSLSFGQRRWQFGLAGSTHWLDRDWMTDPSPPVPETAFLPIYPSDGHQLGVTYEAWGAEASAPWLTLQMLSDDEYSVDDLEFGSLVRLAYPGVADGAHRCALGASVMFIEERAEDYPTTTWGFDVLVRAPGPDRPSLAWATEAYFTTREYRPSPTSNVLTGRAWGAYTSLVARAGDHTDVGLRIDFMEPHYGHDYQYWSDAGAGAYSFRASTCMRWHLSDDVTLALDYEWWNEEKHPIFGSYDEVVRLRLEFRTSRSGAVR